jgi:3-oxoacyl-[acyl-carrier protein] reductase
MDLGLRGRRAIVTGATRGIGWHTAAVLADEGCDVGICSRDEADVAAAVARLEEKGVRAFGRAVDVSDGPALQAWVREAAEALGGLDVVVPNVSSLGAGEGDEAWRMAFDVDLMHTVRTVEASLPYLASSGAASIVVVSSIACRAIGPFEGPYPTFKAALIRYVAGLAADLAADGIRANAVSPGTIYFEDGFWGRMERDNPEFFAMGLGRNPMGRMGTPEEVGRAIAFLASPASSFTTGANLVIDGGLSRGVQL